MKKAAKAAAKPKVERLERINPGLVNLEKPVTDLQYDPRNARTHNERNLASLKASLERFGQQKPVVCLRDGTVVAGNGMLMAAKALGWKVIAAVLLNTDDLDEAKAYAIADNRTAELSEWDNDTLSELMAELVAVDRTLVVGFTDAEIDAVMNGWALTPHDAEQVGDHDADKDTFTIKLEGVSVSDKDEVLGAINECMRDKGLSYTAKAY